MSSKKFRLILIAIIIFGTIGAAGGAAFLWHRSQDATRHIVDGDRHMEAGRYREARLAYGRAVGKDNTNLEYLQKLEEALTALRPDTLGRSQEYAREYMSVLTRAASARADRADLHIRALDALQDAAMRSNFAGYWSALDDSATAMLDLLPTSDPEYVDGYYYRALARLNPSRARVLTDDEVEEGVEALETYLEERPDSDRGLALACSWAYRQEAVLRTDGEEALADEALAEADARYAAAVAAAPDGIEMLLIQLRRYITLDGRGLEHGLSEAEVVAIAQAADAWVRENDDPYYARQVYGTINVLDFDGVPDARSLCELIIDRVPDSYPAYIDLANMAMADEDYETGLAMAQAVLDADPLPSGYPSMELFSLRRQAAQLKVRVAVQRWAQAGEDEEEQSSALAEAEAAREDLAELEVDDADIDPPFIYANAVIEYMSGNYDTAAGFFNRYADLVGMAAIDAQTLYYGAMCLERMNQYNLSLEWIERALQNYRQPVPILLRAQAALLASIGEFDRALEVAAVLVEQDPAEYQSVYDDILAGQQLAMGVSDDPIEAAVTCVLAAMADDDNEAARDCVESGLAFEPGNVRLLSALAEIENREGNSEEAIRIVEKALEANPDNSRLEAYLATLRNDDVVDAALAFIEEQGGSADDQRIARLVVMLQQANKQEQLAARLEVSGDTAGAEKARATAAKAEAQIDKDLPAAIEASGDSAEMIEFQLMYSLKRSDWEAAEAFVERARTTGPLGADGAGGYLFEARLAFSMGDYDRAIRAAREATVQKPMSDLPWSMLGMLLVREGNIEEGIAAYEAAYARNSRKRATVVALVELLARMGQPEAALEKVKLALARSPRDGELKQIALLLEESLGNLATVLVERRRTYRENPADLQNAHSLAWLLSQNEPTLETILDADGQARITSFRWNQMNPDDQKDVIDRETMAWRAEAEKIVERTKPEDIASREYLAWAILKAECMRIDDKAAAGASFLFDIVKSQTDKSAKLHAMIVLADYHKSLGAAGAAATTYSAMLGEDETVKEPYFYIAQLFVREGQFVRVVELCDQLIEKMNGQEVDLMTANVRRREVGTRRIAPLDIEYIAIEAEIKSNKVADARARFDRVFADRVDRTVEEMLLEARLVSSEADLSWENNNADEAELKEAEFARVIGEVEDVAPSQKRVYILRALRTIAQFDRELRDSLLDEALSELRQAERIVGADREIVALRVNIFRKQGDSEAAIREIRTTLNESPRDDELRRELIRMLVRVGEREQAIGVYRDAIELYGQSPAGADWQRQLGEMYLGAMGDPDAAEAEFKEAYETAPSELTIVRLNEALFAQEPPALGRLMAVFKQVESKLDTEPRLRLQKARAEAMNGNDAAAIADLRKAYEAILDRDDITLSSPGLRAWFAGAARVFPDDPARIDALARELAGEKADHPGVLSGIASVWAQREDDGLSQAIEIQQVAIDGLTDDTPGLSQRLPMELAAYYIKADRLDDARETYLKLIAIYPNLTQALNNLAYLLVDEDPARAVEYAGRAATLAPADAMVLDTLGWAYFKNGDIRRSEKYLRRSVDLEESASTHIHLACALIEMDELERANDHLEQAAQLNDTSGSPDPEMRAEIDQLTDDIRERRGG